jgi:signal transduction histidine kinase
MAFIRKLGPATEHPGVGLSSLLPDPRMRSVAMLAGLAASLWITIASLPSGVGTAIPAAVGIAGAAWLILATIATGPVIPASITVMAAAGALTAVTDAYGLIFTGVAASAAAVAFDAAPALAMAGAGPAAYAADALVHHGWPGQFLQACTATLAGLLAGGSRRMVGQRAAHQADLAVARRHAELARLDAELADERNRLARDLHDVLAHTLGALSIQLTAIDSLARKHQVPATLQEQIERGTRLVGAGLEEARQAVRALREDTAPLPAQLERLCALGEAGLTVTGTPRQLSAAAALALYRTTQEALTNATKHAPGAPVTLTLTYNDDGTVLSVRNPAPAPGTPAPLHATGGGYGLAGMRERLARFGGSVRAGPTGDGGWQVTAAIPARAEQDRR